MRTGSPGAIRDASAYAHIAGLVANTPPSTSDSGALRSGGRTSAG